MAFRQPLKACFQATILNLQKELDTNDEPSKAEILNVFLDNLLKETNQQKSSDPNEVVEQKGPPIAKDEKVSENVSPPKQEKPKMIKLDDEVISKLVDIAAKIEFGQNAQTKQAWTAESFKKFLENLEIPQGKFNNRESFLYMCTDMFSNEKITKGGVYAKRNADVSISDKDYFNIYDGFMKRQTLLEASPSAVLFSDKAKTVPVDPFGGFTDKQILAAKPLDANMQNTMKPKF